MHSLALFSRLQPPRFKTDSMASCAPITALNYASSSSPKSAVAASASSVDNDYEATMSVNAAAAAAAAADRTDSPARSSDDDSTTTTASASTASSVSGFFFDRGEVSIPHPEKVFKGGEDAYFITELNSEFAMSGNNVFAFGVADGVGGWASSGVDPAVFAQTLMQNCEEYFIDMQKDRDDMENMDSKTPVYALRHALDRTLEKNIRGSSTAMVCLIQDQVLHLANVGDSGLYILRKVSSSSTNSSLNGRYEISFKSEDQLHGFNFPYQLGISSSDRPENAICASVELQAGDILIAASDGLFDNLFDEDVLEFVCKNCSKSAQAIAQGLGHWAYSRSNSCTASSPFALKAQEIGSYFPGGKSDDITILVFKVADN